jgi:hypothetical protein
MIRWVQILIPTWEEQNNTTMKPIKTRKNEKSNLHFHNKFTL